MILTKITNRFFCTAKSRLNAISPIDGRYRDKTENLNDYFSEKALMKYRIQVEAKWLLYLCKEGLVKKVPSHSFEKLEQELLKIT